jgi:hypothetical protein
MHLDLSAVAIALAFLIPSVAQSQDPGASQLPAVGSHQGVDGLIPGTKRYNVTFDDRKFTLDEFGAAIESGRSADDVERIVARMQGLADAERAGFKGEIEAMDGRVHFTFWLIDACTIDVPLGKLGAVRALPGVARVDPDLPVQPAILTATNASNHNTDAVQAAGNRGTGFGVAVIDTGQDSNMGGSGRPHRIYFRNGNTAITNAGGIGGSLLVANVSISGVVSPDDTNGHGTAVMGIAAGSIWGGAGADHGHANDAYKVGYSICLTAGSCSSSLALEAQAWQQAATDKVRYNLVAANMSLNSSPSLLDVSQQAIDAAALLANIVPVTSAGNTGTGGTGGSSSTANGLAVAAANSNIKTVAAFSTRGPIPVGGTRTFPDIMANGVNLVTPMRDNDAANFVASGTSMAAPHVCGSAALVKFARPNASAREIKAILLASSETVAGTENEVGQGYLRSDRAVACAASPDTTITSTIASTGTPNDHLLNVTAGQVVKIALTWFRHNVALATYSDLGLTVLNGATAIVTKNSPANLYEVVSFTAPVTGALIVRVNAVSLVQNPQPYAVAAFAAAGSQPVFQGGPTGQVTISGGGCAGTFGIPSLHPSGTPTIGAPLTLNVTFARPSTVSVMVIGSTQIAIDLTPIGAPGCFLRASPDITVAVPIGAAGTGSLTIGLPNNPGLIGLSVYGQDLLPDPPNILVVTNVLCLKIGTRGP